MRLRGSGDTAGRSLAAARCGRRALDLQPDAAGKTRLRQLGRGDVDVDASPAARDAFCAFCGCAFCCSFWASLMRSGDLEWWSQHLWRTRGYG